MFQMMGVFAEFERAMIVEHLKSGLARAKAEGKPAHRYRHRGRDTRSAGDRQRNTRSRQS